MKSSPSLPARCLIALLAALALPAPSSAQDEVSAAQVNDAIEKGIRWLAARQRRRGNWDEYGGGARWFGGHTSLATLALLSCDIPPDDARVRDALAYLREVQTDETYSLALQTMVFQLASPKKDFPLIERNAQRLLRNHLNNGMFNYAPSNGGGDNSNTQYGLLGLHAAAEAGVAIPDRVWNASRLHFERNQSPQGSWGYHGHLGPTGSMTVAGVSSLVIINRHTQNVKTGVVGGRKVNCMGPRNDVALKRALGWMGRNFFVDRNPGGGGQWLYYYLYGLERAGRLSAQRFLGDNDWYRVGARHLVGQQQPDGSWAHGRGFGESQFQDTCFALLFLSKGRIPILVNKLQYGQTDDWNNAPTDVHNLTDFVAGLWKKQLNWQTVNIQVAKVEDLLQAPVVQLSGHDAPKLTDRDIKTLREYVQQGGYIMADANCSLPGFDQGFREVCKRMFPDPEQALKPIEPGHGVWNSLFQLEPNWPLEGINVGCRTAIFYSPEDMSCQWEYKKDPNSISAFRMGANIIAYATGPEQLLDKLDERKVFRDTAEDKIRRNFLQIAKIKHNGDWNLAPRAVRNLMASLKEIAKVDVVNQQREIALLDPNLTNYPLAYMHGRTKFLISDEEQKLLAEYLQTNGVLLADACCSSEPFDAAFRELMKKMFPGNPLKPIPADHELMTEKIGYDLQRVALNAAAGGAVQPPVLEGIEIEGRLAVIYSRYDLGCALEKQSSRDCKGYTHESAIKIATNVALFALKQ